ncbi:34718_t:CDS:2, partial [Gigaspora margarita]
TLNNGSNMTSPMNKTKNTLVVVTQGQEQMRFSPDNPCIAQAQEDSAHMNLSTDKQCMENPKHEENSLPLQVMNTEVTQRSIPTLDEDDVDTKQRSYSDAVRRNSVRNNEWEELVKEQVKEIKTAQDKEEFDETQ